MPAGYLPVMEPFCSPGISRRRLIGGLSLLIAGATVTPPGVKDAFAGPHDARPSRRQMRQLAASQDEVKPPWHAFLWDAGTMTDLGTLGGAISHAADINESGQVVGESETASGEMHAFLWEAGNITDLGTLGGATSRAVAVNSSGQVVGWSTLAESEEIRRAFRWDSGEIEDLGTLGGDTSEALDINDHGWVIGFSYIDSNEDLGFHAFRWNPLPLLSPGCLPVTPGTIDPDCEISRRPLTDLHEILGISSVATALNNAEEIAGDVGSAQWQAHLWTPDGGETQLGTLGGAISRAAAINEIGQIVGWSSTKESEELKRAFIWEEAGMTSLGTLGGDSSQAFDVNDSGQVVGESSTASGATRAFLWEAGIMTDLGILDGESSTAVAVNNDGQVVGNWHKDLQPRAFRWEAGAMIDLGTLGGGWSVATVINGNGQVIGDSEIASGAVATPAA